MKVLEFTAKSFYDLIRLRAKNIFLESDSWFKDAFPQNTYQLKSNFQKYFALVQDQFDSEIEAEFVEVLAVHYFLESNCGLVKLLRLENSHKILKSRSSQQSLVKAAKNALDEVAQVNQCKDVCEVFYHVTTTSNSSGSQLMYLYDMGFRLVETELVLDNSQSNERFYLLVYKPSLVPDFQFENGILPAQVETGIIVKFLKELLTSFAHANNSGLSEHHVGELQALTRNLEKNVLTTKLFVRSSFPWNGRSGLSDNQVAVIGGGMAGLAAAASLSETGFDVVLLEASNYLGGRVKQAKPFKGFAPVDLGGDFIHGSDSIINRIAKENGWSVQPCHNCEGVKNEVMFYHKGSLHPFLSDHPDIKKTREAWDEVITLWDKVAKGECFQQNPECSENKRGNATDLPKDESTLDIESHGESASCHPIKKVTDKSAENGAHFNLRAMLTPHRDMTILEWLKSKQCNDDVIAVFDALYCQSVGAMPSQMGLFESSREEHAWKYGDGNFRLADSYSKLVKYLLDKCTRVDKRLCWQVKEIDWRGVTSQTSDGKLHKPNSGGKILLKNQHGEVLSAKHVIIAVPLTVLKDGDINFIPTLPENKRKAVDMIQMRGALKIVCGFKSKFWSDNLCLVLDVRGFVSQIWMYTRDSPVGDDKCHVIVGFQTARPAEEKIGLSGKEVLDGFLQQLDEIFSTHTEPRPATNSLLDFVYYHWSNHPFIRGGYSSPTVYAEGMRHALAASVQNRLFFAGEATSVTVCGTVHTAMESGFRAAREVCSRDKCVPHTEFK